MKSFIKITVVASLMLLLSFYSKPISKSCGDTYKQGMSQMSTAVIFQQVINHDKKWSASKT